MCAYWQSRCVSTRRIKSRPYSKDGEAFVSFQHQDIEVFLSPIKITHDLPYEALISRAEVLVPLEPKLQDEDAKFRAFYCAAQERGHRKLQLMFGNLSVSNSFLNIDNIRERVIAPEADDWRNDDLVDTGSRIDSAFHALPLQAAARIEE